MLTMSFSMARQKLTEIADRVENEGAEYTIFKRSKPIFKIVPVAEEHLAAPRSRAEAARRYAGRNAKRSAIPDGGEELLEYAMQLRSRAPKSERLDTMTVEDMKRELGERHA